MKEFSIGGQRITLRPGDSISVQWTAVTLVRFVRGSQAILVDGDNKVIVPFIHSRDDFQLFCSIVAGSHGFNAVIVTALPNSDMTIELQ